MSNWLLPENLADVLPMEARRIEDLRHRLLDLYRKYGFELVCPPLVEYIDSLLSGTGSDLNLRTCKLIDQLSGRTMGIRADMTPQITRIDAHLLNRNGVTRLCYCGNVFHARPVDALSSREFLQIGAEIYGHSGVEADLEIIQMALDTVHTAGIDLPRLDLSHPGVVRSILELDHNAYSNSDLIISLLKEKDTTGISELTKKSIRSDTIRMLQFICSLYGNVDDVISRARKILPSSPGIISALDSLQVLTNALLPNVQLSIDLADVWGYGYHSGVKFALYADGWREVLVTGGRYDNVSLAFGRARPATGFSLNLRLLASGLKLAKSKAILAPWGRDPLLIETIRGLRRKGEIVVQVLPGDYPDQDEFLFDRKLVLFEGIWQVSYIS
ncbi:ATP phosphoribosyltransferase regulatory subunit hisZ [Candidatus Kinetoplastibacterium blastocrithidii TCC012E]|uniref:ATP phosphoribosyltransferase regulatory subunit n=1 Tax=Candidatus Kinetoplastidibacterium blastocrithidiae TCC012E TaxID=1208922 RepID=M1LBJ9_9PROT|nr:ATP phosphoribosyltransferase regulatory subunit [Candidatus Kinetoplastibacterium blastocrithidii]AFZ83691.1 ATP phosphoribosyltransferase regulatory subunit [Candidatus Kinetoplastibacterium blastocrithidii (ex Strigomonas culicis)]AGF49813.1 ATP phosphoribosyltransferase regulatory subunit hisZ [Candidatus Kinetoplastibacterium blastocrithidii TCC012E]